jgi:hypothetical protein
LRQRRLAHASIDALPSPGDAFHFVVFGQPSLPKTKEKSRSLPTLKVRMD